MKTVIRVNKNVFNNNTQSGKVTTYTDHQKVTERPNRFSFSAYENIQKIVNSNAVILFDHLLFENSDVFLLEDSSYMTLE